MDERLVAGLEAAKALIVDETVWGKGEGLAPPTHGLCAMNACCCAAVHEYPLVAALEKELPDGPWQGEMLPVAFFNDMPKTTHADIMALFDRAIASAKAA